jgi:hypothetical protein
MNHPFGNQQGCPSGGVLEVEVTPRTPLLWNYRTTDVTSRTVLWHGV